MAENLSSRRLVRARAQLHLEGGFRYVQSPGVHPDPLPISPRRVNIELVLGGRGWLFHEGEWHEVGPGHLLWHRPGQHTIGRSDFTRPYSCLAIWLRTPPGFRAHVPRFHSGIDPAAATEFAREVSAAMLDDSADRSMLRDFVVGRLALWLHQSERRSRERRLPAPIQEVLAWMERHHRGRCTLPDLARAAGWSTAHLHEVFRTHLKTTPHRWLLGLRVRSARVRLAETSDPIKQIAVECGFADASAFIHAFRAATGLTPAAYRRNQRGFTPTSGGRR